MRRDFDCSLKFGGPDSALTGRYSPFAGSDNDRRPDKEECIQCPTAPFPQHSPQTLDVPDEDFIYCNFTDQALGTTPYNIVLDR